MPLKTRVGQFAPGKDEQMSSEAKSLHGNLTQSFSSKMGNFCKKPKRTLVVSEQSDLAVSALSISLKKKDK
jgi:hypothetical protein